jgi:predicted phage terminase large subunit-like protein
MNRTEKIELLHLLEEKRRRRARDDLSEFCKAIEIPGAPINEQDPDCEQFYPDRVTPAAHHILINDALMRVEQKQIKRLMIFMPPGSGKSVYSTVVFPSWFMGRRRGRNVICASYGTDLARKFSRRTRQVVRSKEYRDIFGTDLVPDNRSAETWELQNQSSYMCAGIQAGITGNRADCIICDDPIRGRQDADSPTIRENVWEEYKASIRTRLKPNGSIVIINTRWHEDDLCGRILPKTWNGESGWIQAQDGEQWYVICLQAQCTRPDDPLGRKIGDWLWTDWFSPAHWAQEKITQGERNWSALYQQCPTPSEGGIFKRHWFQRYGTPADDGIIIQSIDTGNKPGELNDPSVIGTWRISRHGFQLLHVWRERVDFPSLKRMVKSSAMQWKPDGIIVEDKASGTQLIQELRATPVAEFPFSVIPFDPQPHGDKIMRANDVSPTVEAGRVWLPEAAPWLLDFEAEIFAFPLSTTKDQVDMVSQFLKWAIRHNVALQAWGTGQMRDGLSAHRSASQVDENVGYGVVRSDTDTEGF